MECKIIIPNPRQVLIDTYFLSIFDICKNMINSTNRVFLKISSIFCEFSSKKKLRTHFFWGFRGFWWGIPSGFLVGVLNLVGNLVGILVGILSNLRGDFAGVFPFSKWGFQVGFLQKPRGFWWGGYMRIRPALQCCFESKRIFSALRISNSLCSKLQFILVRRFLFFQSSTDSIYFIESLCTQLEIAVNCSKKEKFNRSIFHCQTFFVLFQFLKHLLVEFILKQTCFWIGFGISMPLLVNFWKFTSSFQSYQTSNFWLSNTAILSFWNL